MSIWAQGFEFEGDRFDEDCPPGQNCKRRKWGLNTPGKILGAVGAASIATTGIAHALKRRGRGAVTTGIHKPSLKSPGSVRTRSPFMAKAPQHPGVVRKRNTRVRPKNMGAGDIKRSLNNPNQTWEI